MYAPKFDLNQFNKCLTAIKRKDSPLAAIKSYKGLCAEIYDFFAWLRGINLSNGRQEVSNLAALAKVGDAVQQKNLKSKIFYDGTKAQQTEPFLIENDNQKEPQYGYLMQIENENKVYVVQKSNCPDTRPDKLLHTYEELTFAQIQDQLVAHEHEFFHITRQFNWVDSSGHSDFKTLMDFFRQLDPGTQNLEMRVKKHFEKSSVRDKEWTIFINFSKEELEAPITDSTDGITRLQLPADGNEYVLQENKSGIDIYKVSNLTSLRSMVCNIPNLSFNSIKEAAKRK